MGLIVVDIMTGEGKFLCTIRLPLDPGLIEGYISDVPILRLDALKRRIEKHRPSLAGKDYRIFFLLK